MRLKPALTADDAEAMAKAVRSEALARGWRIAVAIVDDGGHVLRIDRMDGTGSMASDIAMGKARMSALTRRTSKFWEERIEQRPGFLAFQFGLPIQGAVPIFHSEECVGAIGVSGVGSDEDELLAKVGLAAISADQIIP